MISENLTIVVPTTEDKSINSLLNELSNQEDIEGTRVIVVVDLNIKSVLSDVDDSLFDKLNIEVLESDGNKFKITNDGVDLVETDYTLIIDPDTKIENNMELYDCLVRLKKFDNSLIVPKLKLESLGLVGGVSNTISLKRYNSNQKTHPFTPLSFFFVKTEVIGTLSGFTTYQVEVDEEISTCSSVNPKNVCKTTDVIHIPNVDEVLNKYIERVNKLKSNE